MTQQISIPFYHFPKDKLAILKRVNPSNEMLSSTKKIVAEILQNIKLNGDDALIKYTKKFDGADISRGIAINMQSPTVQNIVHDVANGRTTQKFCTAVKIAIDNVQNFHKNTKLATHNYIGKYKEQLSLRIMPMETAGIYIPGGSGGKTPLISSLIMNYVPAKIAGVEKIVCITPPMPNGQLNEKLLYVLNLLGAKHVYTGGGAQAIAALAYGTKSIEKVDIITGPGNAYVNEAKRMVLGEVMIDGLYGNSEIVIISDGSTPASHIAADMLSQCEHAGGELALLITNSQSHGQEVLSEIQKFITRLDRKKEMLSSLKQRGAIAIVEDFTQAANLANLVAPEHLELLTKNTNDLLAKIKHAGAIFIGAYASEPIGDYIAGTNHVLPTAGAARFSSPLGVYTFQRRQNIIKYNNAAFKAYAPHAIELAKSERLSAHQNALEVREMGEIGEMREAPKSNNNL